MANKSVEAFKRLTVDLMRDVLNDSVRELNAQADTLVATMKAVCPVGPTGNLKASIRKEPGRKITTVVVKAGGALTTREYVHGPRYEREVRIGSGDTANIARVTGGGGFGRTYDYSRAVEFGTSHESAHPFFFPTYRLKRKGMRSAMKRKITKRIKEYSAE
jgi:HK97 gp10 family phage protein